MLSQAIRRSIARRFTTIASCGGPAAFSSARTSCTSGFSCGLICLQKAFGRRPRSRIRRDRIAMHGDPIRSTTCSPRWRGFVLRRPGFRLSALSLSPVRFGRFAFPCRIRRVRSGSTLLLRRTASGTGKSRRRTAFPAFWPSMARSALGMAERFPSSVALPPIGRRRFLRKFQPARMEFRGD